MNLGNVGERGDRPNKQVIRREGWVYKTLSGAHYGLLTLSRGHGWILGDDGDEF